MTPSELLKECAEEVIQEEVNKRIREFFVYGPPLLCEIYNRYLEKQNEP